jgi:hypothetical protein
MTLQYAVGNRNIGPIIFSTSSLFFSLSGLISTVTYEVIGNSQLIESVQLIVLHNNNQNETLTFTGQTYTFSPAIELKLITIIFRKVEGSEE